MTSEHPMMWHRQKLRRNKPCEKSRRLLAFGAPMNQCLQALVVSADSRIGGEICDKLGIAGTTRRHPTLGRLPFDLANPTPLPIAGTTYFCGGITRFGECEANPDLARQINFTGTVETARAMVNAGGKVVFLSSVAAETHSDTVYGRLKLEAEQEFMKFGNWSSIYRFGPVAWPSRTVTPCGDYQPISPNDLIEILTGKFWPGLHRVLNAPDMRIAA